MQRITDKRGYGDIQDLPSGAPLEGEVQFEDGPGVNITVSTEVGADGKPNFCAYRVEVSSVRLISYRILLTEDQAVALATAIEAGVIPYKTFHRHLGFVHLPQ